MINPFAMGKLKSGLEAFQANHPKFYAFITRLVSEGVTEDTIIEITIQKPGEAPITSNMKVRQSDLDLLNSLKDMR